MSISSSVVLAKLTISTWTASKKDKMRTEEVLNNNHADGKAGRFYKNIMVGTNRVKDLTDYAAQCRLKHTGLTFPWEDRGFRGLPTSMFMDYKAEVNKRRDRFLSKRDEVCDNYGALCEIASHYLGDMHDPDDYPEVDEVFNKYAFEMIFAPMPETGHLVLDLPAQELADMRETLQSDTDVRLNQATRSSWDRLYKMLQGMSQKLTDKESDAKARWYDSFVDNPRELCDLLTHLNVTDDPDLERARKQLEDTLAGVSVGVLKESPIARESMKGKVDTILKQFEW